MTLKLLHLHGAIILSKVFKMPPLICSIREVTDFQETVVLETVFLFMLEIVLSYFLSFFCCSFVPFFYGVALS